MAIRSRRLARRWSRRMVPSRGPRLRISFGVPGPLPISSGFPYRGITGAEVTRTDRKWLTAQILPRSAPAGPRVRAMRAVAPRLSGCQNGIAHDACALPFPAAGSTHRRPCGGPAAARVGDDVRVLTIPPTRASRISILSEGDGSPCWPYSPVSASSRSRSSRRSGTGRAERSEVARAHPDGTQHRGDLDRLLSTDARQAERRLVQRRRGLFRQRPPGRGDSGENHPPVVR